MKIFSKYICMCVHLYIHNKYTPYTHTYYVNKKIYFGKIVMTALDLMYLIRFIYYYSINILNYIAFNIFS